MELVPLIIAKDKLEKYHSPDFNKDYRDISFDIDSGSILGNGGYFKILITKDLGEPTNTPSIFSIVERTDNEKQMGINLYSDKIKIKLNKEDYEIYANLKGSKRYNDIFISLVVIPSLIEVFSELKKHQGETNPFEDYRWFGILKNALKKEGIELEFSELNILTIAQRIFDMPLNRAMKALREGDEE